MIVTLTQQEMVRQWKLRRGILPLRADADITQSEPTATDEILKAEIADWYLNLLDTAPAALLPLSNLADETVMATNEDGSVTLLLPEGCRRVVRVRLEGWKQDAEIVSEGSEEAKMAVSPYIGGGAWQPVAVVHPGGIMTLHRAETPTPRLLYLIAVSEPARGSYTLDESLLSTINTDTL